MSQKSSVALEDNVFGVVAEYKSPGALLEAVKAVRQAGFTAIDTYTPFPIHGMDKAMGLPPSKLPWLVLCGGLGRCVSLLQYGAASPEFIVSAVVEVLAPPLMMLWQLRLAPAARGPR